MCKQPTKYYSNRQETSIAEYLGWSVVAGSGARSFHPGDIKSEDFLGECKTHVSLTDTIYLYISVWDKICDEAVSAFRKPALFVDNGSQRINHTWCVVPKSLLPTHIHVIDIAETASKLIKYSTTRLSFKHDAMKELFSSPSEESQYLVASFKMCNQLAYLMPLTTFHDIYEEGGTAH